SAHPPVAPRWWPSELTTLRPLYPCALPVSPLDEFPWLTLQMAYESSTLSVLSVSWCDFSVSCVLSTRLFVRHLLASRFPCRGAACCAPSRQPLKSIARPVCP